MTDPHAPWTSLARTPLLWLTLTVGAYLLGRRLQRLAGGAPWANPVLFSIASLCALLLVTGTPYSSYFAGAQFLHFLLGPVTVALGAPLAANVRHVRRSLGPMTLALAAGSAVSLASGVLVVRWLGGPRELALSMAPKAATTPIAMEVARQIGGAPTLTAVLAVMGGVLAAVAGEPLLRALKVDDLRAHGLAAGVAGSGVAAAQAARLSPVAAAFAALGIGLNGLLTALLAPLAVWLAG